MNTFTNNTNIPLSLALWLTVDNYDYSKDKNTISVTSLIKPIKSIILSSRLNNSSIDVSDLVQSRMGSVLHDSIESSWLENTDNLKYFLPQKILDKININPQIPSTSLVDVYLEKRVSRQLGNWTVTGKFDFCSDGCLEDFKSTSVTGYLLGSNVDKYREQGSMYRWLNPDIITKDYMYIRYVFTDWNKQQSFRDKNYPPNRLHSQKIELMSLEDTENMIKSRLNLIDKYINSDESEIPPCTREELWQREDVYKYYKNPDKLDRSTKNFSNYYDAYERLVSDNSVGVIKTIIGDIKRCNYCSAISICNQAREYINEGLVKL